MIRFNVWIIFLRKLNFFVNQKYTSKHVGAGIYLYSQISWMGSRAFSRVAALNVAAYNCGLHLGWLRLSVI